MFYPIRFSHTNRLRAALSSLGTISFVLVAIAGLVQQASAQTNRCISPYLQMTGVGHAGNVPADPTQGELTIQRINIGEPFVSCTDNTITVVMKVNNLDPAGSGSAVLPANSGWQVLFNVVGTDSATHTIYIILDTFPPFDNSGVPNFALGRRDPDPTTGGTVDEQQCFEQPPLFSCPQIAGSTFTNDGTITFKINVATGIAFTAPSQGSGVAFTWDGSATGSQMQSIIGNTFLLAGVFLETIQTTGPAGPTYTRGGNKSCGPIPLAVLTSSPSPASGPIPLAITFDGSSSSDPNPCATLNSYSLNFGDGNPVANQSTPVFPPHTYSAAGTYTASLTVANTLNQVSTNPAQITVTATSVVSPPLSKVVSRKNHGGTDFDITLFDIANPTAPRGVECRSGGGPGNYDLVFTFVNNLINTAGITASVTSGIGSVSTTAAGPGANQYTVSLTGVANQQYVSVGLSNVQDSVGNSGAVAGPQMGVLLGDATGNGIVSNAGDVNSVKAQVSLPVTASNFRNDITANGVISNSGDVAATKAQVSTQLSPPP